MPTSRLAWLLVFATASCIAEPVTEEWPAYGRDFSEQRFVRATQIHDGNVERLGLAWYLDLPEMRSLVSTPLVVGGVMYFSGSYSVVHAVDAATGRLLWRYDPETLEHAGKNRRVLWDTNRGLAYKDGRLFVASGDGRLLAIDSASGNLEWSVRTLDPDTPRTITGAPRVFNDLVVIGHGGADVGPVRGYVTAYHQSSGKRRWRFYTVPGNPADGFEDNAMRMAAGTWTGDWWTHGGGGTVWNAITYDPDFNHLYLGSGNGSPWNRKIRSPRGGDNLFLSSIVALDADTGTYVWHYQTTPGETWDFNSAMDIVLAELEIGGERRKVLMHAPKNGFFYVLERPTGRLLSAEKLGKVTWASHVDMESGRPVELPNARYPDGEVTIWPGPFGAHSWHPMSYNPGTGLVYIPYQEAPGYYNDREIEPAAWQSIPFSGRATGVNILGEDIPLDGTGSALLAWDPVAQRPAWKVSTPGVWNAGTLTTAGNLVFQGRADGTFVAYDADTGEELWCFDAGLGISAPPISYVVQGRQYIALLVGWGGAATALGGTIAAQHGWDYGSHMRRLLVFSLDAKGELPTARLRAQAPTSSFSEVARDPARISRGRVLYADHCGVCHGSGAAGGGYAPDLRTAHATASAAVFVESVNGGRPGRGMPSFSFLSESAILDLRIFVVQKAMEQQSKFSELRPRRECAKQ